MRILGIDYGRARLGLALTDEDGIVASPLPVLARSARDVDEIATLAREWSVGRIVVGLPLHMDGGRGEMADEAAAYAERIRQRAGVPVDLFDERWTTSEAERALIEGDVPRKRRKALRDGLAAVLLVQAYSAARSGDPGAHRDEEI